MKNTRANPKRHSKENIAISMKCAPMEVPTLIMTSGTPISIVRTIQPGTGARLLLEEVGGGVGSFIQS